jgi:predicted permease
MLKDLAAAVRSLRRAPAFAGLVVFTLALGIGATTAMFSVVDSVLLNPLPFPNGDRLSGIRTVTAPRGVRAPGGALGVIQALRERTEIFSAVEAYGFGSANVTGGGDPEIVTAPSISPGLLTSLGARPLLGRLFTQEEAAAGGVVLMSERFWASRFGSDPAIVGREITVDDRPHRVVGILPRQFRFPEGTIELWRPIDLSPTGKPAPLQVVATRQQGVSPAEADARLQALTTELRDRGVLSKDQTVTTDLLSQQRHERGTQQSLYMMFGAVALVLLVACVNVTNLLLVRSSSRRGELSLMTALGASRGQLVRGILGESLVLASTGCALGLLLAQALLSLMVGTAPPQLRFLTNVSPELDWRALAFAAAAASLTCLVVGVLPAWRTSRIDAIDALKQRALGVIGSRDDWWQGTLVASQLALVLVLLAGSGLLLRSFTRLVTVDPGFEVNRSAVLTLQLSAPRYGGPGQGLAFMQELERKVEATPGVAATISGGVPPTGGGFYFELSPEADGFAKVDVDELPFHDVAPDFFETMGIPIRQGRSFERGDPGDVVIVNDVMARRLWGDVSPVGRRFRTDAEQPWWTVVGVAGDVKAMGPSDPMGEGMEIYRPLPTTSRAAFFAMVVRAPGDPAGLLPSLKQRVWEIDPKQPIIDAETMAERMEEAVVRPLFFMRLALAFAVTSALLAAVGVYGVAAYWVSRRNRELAIRVALGASRAQVMTMVMARSVRLATIGCLAGIALALWGAKAIESMLFQVESNDPVTLISVTAMLGVLALLASTLPAMKASRVDPMSVLRAE